MGIRFGVLHIVRVGIVGATWGTAVALLDLIGALFGHCRRYAAPTPPI